jgi:hypothetical protein
MNGRVISGYGLCAAKGVRGETKREAVGRLVADEDELKRCLRQRQRQQQEPAAMASDVDAGASGAARAATGASVTDQETKEPSLSDAFVLLVGQ